MYILQRASVEVIWQEVITATFSWTNFSVLPLFFADDSQLLASTTPSGVADVCRRLERCVSAVHDWCTRRRLELNPSKTEVIWFGSNANLQNNIVTLKSGLYRRHSMSLKLVHAIRKLGCGFLFTFYSIRGRTCNRLWDIQCQRMAWPWKPG